MQRFRNRWSSRFAVILLIPWLLGTTYKWVDQQGQVHFTDMPPPAGTAYEIVTTSPASADSPPAPSLPAPGPAATEGVPAAAANSLPPAVSAAVGTFRDDGRCVDALFQLEVLSGRPAIDLNVAVTRGLVGRLGPYWPESVLREKTKAWLRMGLAGGEIVSGRVLMRGDLDDWPFRDGEGRFEAAARVADGRLDYRAGWPAARSVEALARFVGPGMEIRGKVGDIGGVEAREVSAVIADFQAPVLTIDYAADGDLPRLLGFLLGSPLRESIGADLSRFRFAGPATARGSLRIPFGSVQGGLSVDGVVDLRDGEFSDPQLGVAIEGIAGSVAYSEHGFAADGLAAELRGKPARLRLAADARAAEKFRAGLTGDFTVAGVVPRFLAAQRGLLPLRSAAAQGRPDPVCSVALPHAMPAGIAGRRRGARAARVAPGRAAIRRQCAT